MTAQASPIDAFKEDKAELLYWAVIDQYRQSLSLDGIGLRLVEQNGGLDVRRLRRIAKTYNVVRGINGATQEEKKRGSDPHAEWFVCELNKLACDWPATLLGRADRCAVLAEKACGSDQGGKNGQSHTNGYQASAVTKLMWFLKPDDWTMFDDLAATGLGIPKPAFETIETNGKTHRISNSITRMKAFYKELDRRNFVEHARSINCTIKTTTDLLGLRGERIIDKFLMLLGSKSIAENSNWKEDVIGDNREFLDLVPPNLKDDLHSIATAIVNKHVNSLLLSKSDKAVGTV